RIIHPAQGFVCSQPNIIRSGRAKPKRGLKPVSARATRDRLDDLSIHARDASAVERDFGFGSSFEDDSELRLAHFSDGPHPVLYRAYSPAGGNQREVLGGRDESDVESVRLQHSARKNSAVVGDPGIYFVLDGDRALRSHSFPFYDHSVV